MNRRRIHTALTWALLLILALTACGKGSQPSSPDGTPVSDRTTPPPAPGVAMPIPSPTPMPASTPTAIPTPTPILLTPPPASAGPPPVPVGTAPFVIQRSPARGQGLFGSKIMAEKSPPIKTATETATDIVDQLCRDVGTIPTKELRVRMIAYVAHTVFWHCENELQRHGVSGK